MVAAVKFQVFTEDVGRGIHNLNTGAIKVALTNTGPTASTDTILANITQISGVNGYTTGGTAVGSIAYSQSGGVASLTGTDVVFTASGGSVGPFRYAVLYNDTPSSPKVDPLIQYWDYGSNVTLADGETFTVDFGSTILTLT